MRKGLDPAWLPIVVRLFLVLSQRGAQPLVIECYNNQLQPNFCQMACGINDIAICEPMSGICFCQPSCHTGNVATLPAAYGADCPLAVDGPPDPNGVAGCLADCLAACPAAVSLEICGDSVLNAMSGMVGTAAICACGCPSIQCPPTPPTTVATTVAPQGTTPLLSSDTLMALAAFLLSQFKLYFVSFKKIYGIVFIVGKVIVIQMLAIFWLWLALTLSQLDFALFALPPATFNFTSALIPSLYRLF